MQTGILWALACAVASVQPDTRLARLLNASWDESHFPLPPAPAPPPQVRDRTHNRPAQCPAGSLFRGVGPCCRGATTRNWRSTHQTSGPAAALTGRDGTGACQGHVHSAEELRMGLDGMGEARTRGRQDLICAGRHAEKTQQEVHGNDGALGSRRQDPRECCALLLCIFSTFPVLLTRSAH